MAEITIHLDITNTDDVFGLLEALDEVCTGRGFQPHSVQCGVIEETLDVRLATPEESAAITNQLLKEGEDSWGNTEEDLLQVAAELGWDEPDEEMLHDFLLNHAASEGDEEEFELLSQGNPINPLNPFAFLGDILMMTDEEFDAQFPDVKDWDGDDDDLNTQEDYAERHGGNH